MHASYRISSLFIACHFMLAAIGQEQQKVESSVVYASYSSKVLDNKPVLSKKPLLVPIVLLTKDAAQQYLSVPSIVDLSTGNADKITSIPEFITSISLSSDKKIVAFSSDAQVYVYDVATKKMLGEYAHSGAAVHKILIADDHKHIVAVSSECIVIFALEAHVWSKIDIKNCCVCFNSDQTRLLIASGKEAKIYSFKGFYCFKKYILSCHARTVSCSNDGESLLACGSDGMLTLLNIKSKQLMISHNSDTSYTEALYTPNGKYIMAVTAARKIHLLDPETFALIADINGQYWNFSNPSLTDDFIIAQHDPYSVDVAYIGSIK